MRKREGRKERRGGSCKGVCDVVFSPQVLEEEGEGEGEEEGGGRRGTGGRRRVGGGGGGWGGGELGGGEILERRAVLSSGKGPGDRNGPEQKD